MPIKFKCSCGQVLSVSSKLAGKTGKCPKCSKALKIPAPKAGAAKAKAKPAAAKPAAASAGVGLGGALDDLLEDAGLTEKKGPSCPQCMASIKPGTVICTKCGFNFETGEKMVEHEAASARAEFDNLYLQEASDNMKREKIMETPP